MREDLFTSVGELARDGHFDTFLIESTGISEPMPVAATFEWVLEDGSSTMVTVMDASTFLPELIRGDELAHRDRAASDTDEQTISDLLIDKVKFANVIVITQIDLVTPTRLGQPESALHRLDPSARQLHARHGAVAPTEVLDTDRYDPVTAAGAAGSADDLAGTHTPETEQYGIWASCACQWVTTS